MDRIPWLITDLRPPVGGVILALVGCVALVVPTLRRLLYTNVTPAEAKRIAALSWLRYLLYLNIALFVLLIIGVTPENLGLALPTGRYGTAAAGVTMLAVLIMVGFVAYARIYNRGRGCYAQHRTDRAYHRTAVVGGAWEAFAFLALPLFGASAARLPITWAALGAIAGYTVAHLPYGREATLLWGPVAAVAMTVYLLSGSLLLPAVLIISVALLQVHIYPPPAGPDDTDWPLKDQEPPPPPLAVIEQPTVSGH